MITIGKVEMTKKQPYLKVVATGTIQVLEKLLYLLQRWDVQNVVLVVTSWDDGMKGRLGAARYRIYLEEAKAVLEQCYLQSLQVLVQTAINLHLQ